MSVLLNWIYLTRLAISSAHHFRVIQRIRQEKLTYLDPQALVELYLAVKHVERTKVPGILVEAGCALGGSALVITATKSTERPFRVFDAFGLIPPPSSLDEEDAHVRYAEITSGQAEGIKGSTYYGYQADLLESVQNSFNAFDLKPADHNVHFVKGFYEETLTLSEPVALAHLDCDWYDSVMTCLNQIVPVLVPGGTLVVDDYYAWSGCRKAVDEYFAGRKQEFEFVKKGRLHIVRR
jgi:asparagine synthase (glutamine-hydrolysing)